MRLILLSILAIFVVPVAVSAANNTEIGVSKPDAASPSTRTLRIYFAGGSASTKPDSGDDQSIDSYETQGGHANSAGVLELPGLYKKTTEHLWLGLLPSLVSEDYSSNYAQDTALAFSRYNLNASGFWFLNSERAEGTLFRFDAGYSYIHRFERINSVSFDKYYNGVDAKLTVGYALRAFSDQSFWSFNLGFFAVSAGAFSETGADITVGIML